ncbi:MAG: hypothetical protein ACREIT_01845 [Tepidisphaeraceae bacterium]
MNENDLDTDNAGDDGLIDAATTDSDLQRLQRERDDLFERLARATTDFKNSQKRMQAEFDQRLQYANSGLI